MKTRVDELIEIISTASNCRGNKLAQFMSENGLTGLREATEKQLAAFMEGNGLKMDDLPDDPIIHCLEQTGLSPDELALPSTECPICGQTAERYVVDVADEIVGCNLCTNEVDAMEYEQEKY